MSENQIQRGQEWLEKLLSLSKIPSKVIPSHQEDGYWLTIDDSSLTPAQIEILIGYEGTAIDAIQYLCNTIVNISEEQVEPTGYTIELNGYRLHRLKELQAIAEKAAAQVRQTGEQFELKSLSSAERRQVHSLLSECDDLETYSIGQEPDRRLVVRLR
ncbi:RNA-binding protein [Kamptonema animale CS-326]|jgi:spoIIIJ-associated protein|uniref:Jag family protein n=1 Tax=Kamptonema animale TaxID=92934 RepID=UPI00232BACAF|nr:R3H domain-containing nucleic acid-binding protein [Kamptonema animale]MDB9512383.1 RNA-binding protein [Kamptonema animale CS-326]